MEKLSLDDILKAASAGTTAEGVKFLEKILYENKGYALSLDELEQASNGQFNKDFLRRQVCQSKLELSSKRYNVVKRQLEDGSTFYIYLIKRDGKNHYIAMDEGPQQS